jgi:hypothetical protein
MAEQPVDEKKFADLAEVYGLLKRDATDMLRDLLDGVSLWRSTARILFGFALLSFALVPLFIWGSRTTVDSGTLSTGLALIAVFLFGLGLVTSHRRALSSKVSSAEEEIF